LSQPGWISADGDAVLVQVRLQPRASRNGITGERAGRLAVRVAAAPVDGRANAALCKLLAKAAGVPRSSVVIVQGESAREKVVRIEGAAVADLAARLEPR
jgi:uncharacterized protein (TIGR00251 family)